MGKPIIARPGSKRQVADLIAGLAPKHSTYIEPFFGSGAVFFAKPLAKKNVLADTHDGIVNLHKSVKAHGCGILTSCQASKNPTYDSAKKAIQKVKAGTASACEVNVAARTSTMAKLMDPSRTVINRLDGKSLKVNKSCPEAAAKLRHASMEKADFRKVMQENNNKSAFAYLDPPYMSKGNGKLGLYKHATVTPEDTCNAVKKFKGKALLSYNDTPEVRSACKGLHMQKIPMRYAASTINFGIVRKTNELLISNYKLPAKLPK